MMGYQIFDELAERYDRWFLENRNVLESEVRLIALALKRPGKTLSIGCGSGLFEMLLQRDHGIEVQHGLEPSEEMAAVARKRGLEVEIGIAEALPYSDASFDTALFNRSPGYIDDLARSFAEAFRILRAGGHVVVADVPAESAHGLLYQFAASKGTWNDPALTSLAPIHPFPIELAAAVRWRTTEEKAELLRDAGFEGLDYAQTLLCHPRFSNDGVDEPIAGYHQGDYVTIRARKPR